MIATITLTGIKQIIGSKCGSFLSIGGVGMVVTDGEGVGVGDIVLTEKLTLEYAETEYL